jgi:hypothetical protein
MLTNRIALSDPVRDEIVDVLHRPKLARFINAAAREDILASLFQAAQWFSPAE